MSEPAPHDCPHCGFPAYCGFALPAKCTNSSCPFYDQTLWGEHIDACLDETLLEEEADTQPQIRLPYIKWPD